MRAVVVRGKGGPDVLEVREVSDPELPPHHVRVAVRAAGVNRADILQRMGFYPAPPGAPPDILGLEYAGVIDAVGSGVSGVRLGERVFGLVPGGAQAEMVVVHEREVCPIPVAISDQDAAAVPEAFITAYDALVGRGGLRPGERVLVHAVGSGVGTAAVQIARAMGCEVVGTSRTASKLDLAARLGLHHGVLVRPNEDSKFADAVREVTNGGADVVLELVGGKYLAESVQACAPRGRVVVVGLTGGSAAELDLSVLLRKRVRIEGTVLRSRPLEEKIEAAQMLARPIASWLTAGTIRPVVDKVFPLEDVALAHEHLANNASFGKVVLRVGGEKPRS